MDAIFEPLGAAVGASVDQIKLISCLLVAYPLGSLFIRIPSSQPGLKHIFNIVIALIYFLPILNLHSALLQLLASIMGTYAIAASVRGPSMPWIVFVFVMGHLTVNHIIRAMSNLSYETMEVTGPQMVLTMKLTTFAWNVWDGRQPEKDLDKWQLSKRVTKYPSILEFLGYSLYFPGVLVGPYCDYSEYMALIDESLFKPAAGRTKRGMAVPTGRKRVAYVKMVSGLVYLGLFAAVGPAYNFSIALTPAFASKSLLHRIALFQVFGLFERCKYYAIWTLTEGSSILTGLGFSGFSPSGATLWDGAANVKPLAIEFPSNFKVLLDSWNMKTNVWLRECVYKRVTPKDKKPGFSSSMITFATSAFWHGIAGGYYLTFIFGGFVTTAARLARGTFRPLVQPAAGASPSLAKHAYDLAATLLSILVLNYAASPFMLLSIKSSIKAWSLLAWYGHILILGSLVFFYAGGQKWVKKFHPKVAAAPQIKREVSSSADVSGASTPTTSFQVPPTFDQIIPPQK